jgi:hypothetical protein
MRRYQLQWQRYTGEWETLYTTRSLLRAMLSMWRRLRHMKLHSFVVNWRIIAVLVPDLGPAHVIVRGWRYDGPRAIEG